MATRNQKIYTITEALVQSCTVYAVRNCPEDIYAEAIEYLDMQQVPYSRIQVLKALEVVIDHWNNNYCTPI